MIEWLKKLYSDDKSASYGRMISTISFIIMICVHVLILNGFFKNTKYVSELTTKLFYLTIGGYSITILKEIIGFIFKNTNNEQ